MRVQKCIDWITATRTKTLAKEVPNFLPRGFEISKELDKIARFESVWALSPSGIVAHSAGNAMCMMFTFTGDDLTTIRDSGISTDNILADCVEKMNSVTRLDYAVDIFDANATPNQVLKLWQQDKIRTHYRVVESYRTLTGYAGETLYFGSRKSEQRIRIYDKAAEQEMLNVDWLRIELQLRKKRSTNLVADMTKHTMSSVGDTRIRELLKIDDLEWWHKALNGVTVELTKLKRNESQWQKWLRTQVLPSIETKIMESPENIDFVREWLFRIELMLAGGEEVEH